MRLISIGLLLLATTAQAQSPAAVQTAINAARKVVANADAAVRATKEYQALLDAQAALRAVEALIPPVVQKVEPEKAK